MRPCKSKHPYLLSSMITEDYFLRIINQLAYVLASVLKLMKLRKYDEALEEIQASAKQLLGMDLRLLTTLSDAECIRLLTLGDRFDVEKCVVMAELLRSVGDIREAQENESERSHCYVTSLSLFLELLREEPEGLPQEYHEKVAELLRRLSRLELPMPVRIKLFHYYEIVKRYDKAEDILFEIVGVDGSFINEGMKYYGRLLQKTDDELIRANLPRDEVESGLRELTKISTDG